MTTPEQRAEWRQRALGSRSIDNFARVAIPALLDEVASAESTIKRLRNAYWLLLMKHHETNHSGHIATCDVCTTNTWAQPNE